MGLALEVHPTPAQREVTGHAYLEVDQTHGEPCLAGYLDLSCQGLAQVIEPAKPDRTRWRLKCLAVPGHHEVSRAVGADLGPRLVPLWRNAYPELAADRGSLA